MPRSLTTRQAYRMPARCLAISVLFAIPAQANVGVPMIGITWLGMLLSLVPIIWVEQRILRSKLQIDGPQSTRFSIVSNLFSTLVGIPVAWLVLFLLELLLTRGGTAMGLDTSVRVFIAVVVQAPWLVPYSDSLHWMVPAATLALLPSYFAASWMIEYRVIWALIHRNFQATLASSGRGAEERSKADIRKAAFSANLASYGILAVATTGWLIASLIAGGTGTPLRSAAERLDGSGGAPPPAAELGVVQSSKPTIRVVFLNPQRMHSTVEVRTGNGDCSTMPTVHTQHMRGHPGWVFSAWAEEDAELCYSVKGTKSGSGGEWIKLDRVQGEEGPQEYQVSIR